MQGVGDRQKPPLAVFKQVCASINSLALYEIISAIEHGDEKSTRDPVHIIATLGCRTKREWPTPCLNAVSKATFLQQYIEVLTADGAEWARKYFAYFAATLNTITAERPGTTYAERFQLWFDQAQADDLHRDCVRRITTSKQQRDEFQKFLDETKAKEAATRERDVRRAPGPQQDKTKKKQVCFNYLQRKCSKPNGKCSLRHPAKSQMSKTEYEAWQKKFTFLSDIEFESWRTPVKENESAKEDAAQKTTSGA